MPKPLFYASIFVAAVLSALMGREALRELGFVSGPALERLVSGELMHVRDPRGLAVIVICGFAIALASIFLRMASFLAARSLFASYFVVFSVACSAFAAVAFGVMHLRARIPNSRFLEDLAAAEGIAGQLLALFVALTLFSVHSYFRVHASRMLSGLSCLPLPAFLLAAVLSTSLSPSSSALATANFAYFGTLCFVFLALAVHAYRHRVLFLESTNLRNLTDVSEDGGFLVPRGGFAN